MTTGVHGPTRARIEEKTLRTDRWWLYPLTTFVVFSAFVVYATSGRSRAPTTTASRTSRRSTRRAWATASGQLRLRTALRLVAAVGGADHPDLPAGLPDDLLLLPQGLLPVFWLSPPACAVAEPHKAYSGETRLPLILNNIHRYFWYAAIVVSLILTYDTVLAFGPAEGESSGIHMGLGSLVFLVNIILIWMYTLSCHSCRHIVGGRLRHFSKHPVRYQMWTWVSKINHHHARYAWLSLFSVALADFYVLLISSGAFNDPRFF